MLFCCNTLGLFLLVFLLFIIPFCCWGTLSNWVLGMKVLFVCETERSLLNSKAQTSFRFSIFSVSGLKRFKLWLIQHAFVVVYIPNRNCQRNPSLLKIMTECLLFHSFRTSRLLLWSLNWNSKLLFLIMIFCSTSMTCSKNSSKIITYWKQWKIARRTDWTTVLRKNKLTIGLVYTE